MQEKLRALAEQTVRRVSEAGRPLEYFRNATALYDTTRDEIVTALPAYEGAVNVLSAFPLVEELYGAEESGRLALQFVYGFLGRLTEPAFDPEVFGSTWQAFWEELSEPEWTWLGLANLQNFRSTSMSLDLGDGITIRGRSFDELAEMGWSEWHLEQLQREFFEGGVNSSYVILAEHKLPKAPDNFVLTDATVYQKVMRVLLALRLFKDGNISMGRMFLIRPASFHLGLGGGASMGFPASRAVERTEYALEKPELSSVRDLYDMLLRYESALERESVNLNLAIRSFSDIYERPNLGREDTQLVDAITAAEALLGTSDEVTFRLAFRVAAILGNDDDDRVRIYDLMRGYYDTRSRVVHGGSGLYNKQGQLRDKPRWHLWNQQDLRDLVRRLLVGFIYLTGSSGHSFGRKFFEERLDSTLLHSTRRSELRVAMGLEESGSAS